MAYMGIVFDIKNVANLALPSQDHCSKSSLLSETVRGIGVWVGTPSCETICTWMLTSSPPLMRPLCPYWMMAMTSSLLGTHQLTCSLSHLLTLWWLMCPPLPPIWWTSPLMRRSLPRHFLPSGKGLVAGMAPTIMSSNLLLLITGQRVMMSL